MAGAVLQCTAATLPAESPRDSFTTQHNPQNPQAVEAEKSSRAQGELFRTKTRESDQTILDDRHQSIQKLGFLQFDFTTNTRREAEAQSRIITLEITTFEKVIAFKNEK